MSIFSFPKQVNENAARLVASGVTTLAVASMVTHAWWIPPLLATGFLLRVGWGPRFSLLARLAMWLAPKLTTPKPVPGAPKRFAQGIGAAFTVSATTLVAADQWTAATWLLGILVACAVAEAGLAFCLGCWAYGQLQRLGVLAPEACETCVVAPEPSSSLSKG